VDVLRVELYISLRARPHSIREFAYFRDVGFIIFFDVGTYTRDTLV